MNFSSGGREYFKDFKFDPRTKFYVLIIGTITLFLSPNLQYEIALALCACIYGLLSKAFRFTLKMSGIYAFLVILNQIGTYKMSGLLQIAIITFTFYIRKIK